ncbi:MAG: 7-carboxy-7-deazaguanine synthase QueE [Bacteroidales bacterium]|nr:7-carboxy-7-deazaguanine synthase QueE [Bacteroidales bacterium]
MTNELLEKGLALPIMETFYSIQGEGFHTGKAAFFLRIGGCDVGCAFCDEKESWDAGRHSLTAVETVIRELLETPAQCVVVTGGEPCLYNLDFLCKRLKDNGIARHIETSGSEPLSGDWDWLCFSPKKGTEIRPIFYNQADEMKVIVETKEDLDWAEHNAAQLHSGCIRLLQPEWSSRERSMPLIIRYILQHPEWRISIQTHKYMHIP